MLTDDGRTDDGRTTDAGVTGILIAHLGAFGSGELISYQTGFSFCHLGHAQGRYFGVPCVCVCVGGGGGFGVKTVFRNSTRFSV